MIKRMTALAAMTMLSLGAPALAQMGGGDPMAMLKAADTNGDGAISRAEYLAYRGSHFTEMDANKDGFLSSADAASDERGGRRMERMIAQADFDKDGKVSRPEFDKAPAPMFDRLDANGDGTVDKAELANARQAFEARRDERGN
ncbi:EF-hand domain-containing protein [Sphingomonas crocodyli]|nr:EF-hand domain-containing protein [Sphingomonas crocodyli]